jgi:stage V sporulation protein D (sporulation-specific penicillin-binding protein)
VLIAFIFAALTLRLSYLQIFSASFLQHLAEEQWTRDLPIAAERGVIYDRNGVALAVSYSSYNVYVRASNVVDPAAVASLLSKVLGLNYEDLYAKATNRGISESLVKMQIEKDLSDQIKKANLKGIYLSENTKRYYPFNSLLTQVLGYTTIDNLGQAGLELFYDKYLKGIDGYSMVQSDISGSQLDNMLSSYVSSIPGADITLTIDYRIQLMLEDALQKLMVEQRPNTATGIVMNPKTGEVLAMGSLPNFNLNDPPRDDIASLMQNSKNLSIVDVYEPGSTFKVLTMAAVLEEKLAKLTDQFYDPGYRIVDGQRINCWKAHGHGQQNLVEGLNNSCNSVFIDLALRLGIDRFYEYFEKYGFGQKSNIDFPAESGGLLVEQSLVKNMDLARMGFGQAIAVTPLQQITAISSVINGGLLMQPYLTKSITSPFGAVIKENKPLVVRRTISEETSETLRWMMEEVITNFAGKYAFIPGYSVSGKTGTTIKYDNGKIADNKFIASFVGAFPAEDPEYIILIVADEPKSGAFFGSIVATPYAKLVLEGIIDYKNIPPVNLEEDLKLIERNIEMPNLVGKSLGEAAGILANLNLQYEAIGTGGIVLEQIPPPGTMLFEREIVLLRL